MEDDESMIRNLQLLIQIEEKKPENERDNALIDECIEEIAKLKGVRSSYSKEEVDAIVVELKHKEAKNLKTKSPRRYVKWLIPVAVILVLTTVAVFASPANRLAISEMTNRFFSSLTPQITYHEDNYDLVFTDDIKEYSSFKALSEAHDDVFLLPFDLEKDLQSLEIMVSNTGQSHDVDISFEYSGFPCLMTLRSLLPDDTHTIEYNTKIGDWNLALYECDDLWIATWVHKKILYQLESASLDVLKSLITNMR